MYSLTAMSQPTQCICCLDIDRELSAGLGYDSAFAFPLPGLLSRTIPRTLISVAYTDQMCLLKRASYVS